MKPADWKAVKSSFLEAIDLDTDARDAYLRDLEISQPGVSVLVRDLIQDPTNFDLDLRRPCWSPKVGRVTSATSAPTAFEPGQTLLGRFEIIEFLGGGGLGEVYQVFDRHQSTFVALKTPRAALAGDPDSLSILRNELNTARSVTHPNICRLYDIHLSVESDTPPFFTMELLEGGTLKDLIRNEGPLETGRARLIAGQLVDALEAAHAKGIVHRDLKTANVMIADGGSRVVVTDFGLAREMAPGADLHTTLTSLAGTPAFMAPEQLQGTGVSFSTDIYALGVVLFEMVTGRLPFEGPTPLMAAVRRLSETAPSPREYRPDLDRRWEAAILTCLERNEQDRPKTVREVLALIDGTAKRRVRRRFVIAAATALPLAAITSFAILSRRSSPLKIDVFDIENESAVAADTDYLCRGVAREMVRRMSYIHDVIAIPRYRTRKQADLTDGAAYAFGGVLEAHDGHYRLIVQLIDNKDGRVLWAEKFDRKRSDDRLDVQGEIARSAVTQLRNVMMSTHPTALRLASTSRISQSFDRAAVAPTSSPTAFDLYMRALEGLKQGTPDSIANAVELLERAVGEDPQFGLAFAALAEADLARLVFGDTPERQYVYNARMNAERAIQVAPRLADAHAVYGAVRQAEWDWRGAEAGYGLALELKPNFPRALRWNAGLLLQFARFDEAIRAMNRAYELDRYDEKALAGHALTLLFADRPGEAAEFLERNIGDRPLAAARYNLAQAYARMAQLSTGSVSDAHFRKSLEHARLLEAATGERSPISDQTYALCYSCKGDLDSAEPYLTRLMDSSASGRTSPLQVAMVLAVQRKNIPALDYIDRALSVRARNLIYLRVNVFLENVRNEPRFLAALQYLGLNT